MSTSLTTKLNAILDIKEAIKDAIEAQGVTVSGDFEDYPDYIAQIGAGGGGDEPAAMTITSCQAGTNNTLGFETEAEDGFTVRFIGTGLTDSLDYASLIQVSLSNTDWVVTYDNVSAAAQDGTWVDINYNVTAPDDVSMWEDTITFTYDEFTGSISVCAFEIRSYEFVSDSTGGINTYPNAMTGQARVYLNTTNSDNYINENALEWITDDILTVVEDGLDDASLEVTSYNVRSSYDSSTYEYSHYIDINYTVTPQDAEAVYLQLGWGEIAPVTHTFVERVPVTSFDFKGVYYLNGNEAAECGESDSDTFDMPIGPDMFIVCENFNSGVNDYSNLYAEVDGIDYNDLQDFVIGRDTYKAIHIPAINGYGAGSQYTFSVNITGASESVYEGSINVVENEPTLPSDAVEVNGVRSTFDDTYGNTCGRYVDTGVHITPDTIVEAEISLGEQYGNMIFGTPGQGDDLTDWRLFNVGGEESLDNPGFYSYKFYFDYGSNGEDGEESYGNRIECEPVEVAGGVFHVICENGHLTVQNNGDDIIDEEGPVWEAPEGEVVMLDNLKVFQTSGSSVDNTTLYNMQIYQNDALVRDFVPVTVNGELKLFDYVTKRYFDFITFQVG